MKHLEKIPDILSMYGVFTSQSTSQVRQEMSITTTAKISKMFASNKTALRLQLKLKL